MVNKESVKLSFEDLDVWQKAVKFANRVICSIGKLDTTRKHYRLIEQLESAATSVSMNIAEGKGRYSKKEFVQFLYISRGSLYETVTLLIICNENKWIQDERFGELKKYAIEIGKMLSSLIGSIKRSMS